MGKNKTIPSGERTIILRVMHFFEEEKKKGSPLLPLKKALSRTSTATGVSLSTISRIKKEEMKILQELSSSATSEACSEQNTSSSEVPKMRPVVVLPTPGKKRPPAHNKMVIDDFTISAIKDIVNNFYKEKKEIPTLNKILAVAKADLNFPGQKETLRKILTEKCGYTFTKCAKKNDLLKGRSEVGFWRVRNCKSKGKKQFGADKKQNKVKFDEGERNNKPNESNSTNNEQQNPKNINDDQNVLNEIDNSKNNAENVKDDTEFNTQFTNVEVLPNNF